MSFYDRLVTETDDCRRQLYAVPQLVDALQGRITRETYIAYLTQAWHHVRHTVPFLMATGARLSDDQAWLRRPIAEYIREEIGHEDWILGDIAAAGGNPDAARASRPHRTTELMIAYNYDYIARRNPVGFFGMVYMLESTSVGIATRGAEAIRASLALPETAFSYLRSHGALDVAHMAFFRATIEDITDPADQGAIVEVAQTAFLLFADVLRSIPHGGKSGKNRDAA